MMAQKTQMKQVTYVYKTKYNCDLGYKYCIHSCIIQEGVSVCSYIIGHAW